MAICSGPGCDRDARAKGLCMSHYRQVLRGQPLAPLGPPSAERGPARLSLRLRVSSDTMRALGAAPAARARQVLEAWSVSRKHGTG